MRHVYVALLDPRPRQTLLASALAERSACPGEGAASALAVDKPSLGYTAGLAVHAACLGLVALFLLGGHAECLAQSPALAGLAAFFGRVLFVLERRAACLPHAARLAAR